ncbi:hypothetical protein FH972_022530 [Carpinus fangiana]|uniref:DUF427 domain-containing protein n=1 Tax=Carpinus fangiana TaxID=176857 RepID=A0A5N6KUS2_9ROSI|nr:hypothetical protein FH972_022530 [Carpinus fangiana]
MATKKLLDPKTFPRPPLLERTSKHLVIKWPAALGGATIADTTSAYWVLETFHPPTYYIPPGDVAPGALSTSSARRTFCEWKGDATYFRVARPDGSGSVDGRAWTYERPSVERFAPIAGFVSFYAGNEWECFVDDEKVEAQPGSFYGGWMTSDIKRESVKGAPGTTGW